jgi:hypothetical protein
VVNFIPWALYLWEDPGTHYLRKEVGYPSNRRLCKPQSLSAFLEERKIPCCYWDLNPVKYKKV